MWGMMHNVGRYLFAPQFKTNLNKKIMLSTNKLVVIKKLPVALQMSGCCAYVAYYAATSIPVFLISTTKGLPESKSS